MSLLLRDLIMNSAILSVFAFVAGHYYANASRLDSRRFKLIIGVAHGLFSFGLIQIGIHVSGDATMDLRMLPIVLSAYLGGPVPALLASAVVVVCRSLQVPSVFWSVLVALTLLALLSGWAAMKGRSFVQKWGLMLGFVLLDNLVVFGWVYPVPFAGTLAPFLSICALNVVFIASIMRFFERQKLLDQQLHKAQQDVNDIVRMQSGFSYKMVRKDDTFVFSMIGGRLLHQLSLVPEAFIGRGLNETIPSVSGISPVQLYHEWAWKGESVSYEFESRSASYTPAVLADPSRPIPHRTLLLTLQPIADQDGRIKEIIGTAVDISDRKKADLRLAHEEERYRTLVESSRDFILALDRGGAILSVNQSLCLLLGLSPGEICGRRLTDFLFRDKERDWSEALVRAVQDGVAQQWEWEHAAGDQIRTYSLTVSPSFSAPSATAGLTVTIHDLTDAVARKEAIKASEAKSRFLANVSHEIRTPLTGILGVTQLLLDTPLSGIQRDFANKIMTSSRTLHAMINEILDFSKYEAGKIPIENIPFALGDLFGEVADIAATFIDRKRIDVVFDILEDAPDRLVGDPRLLFQVLLNLCNNAIKFTSRGYVRVYARAVPGSDGPDRRVLEFGVQDTGIGIAPSKLPDLFRPFAQADDSTSRRFGGTGLGLVICKQLVERMGGTIDVRSEPERGSLFTFEIPFGLARDDSPQAPSPADGWADPTVLLAGGSSIVRDSVERMVRGFGFAVAGTETARDRAGLVVLDLSNEDVASGKWDALVADSRASGLPILALATAHARNGLVQRYGENGLGQMLLKPVSRNRLAQALAVLGETQALRAPLAVAPAREPAPPQASEPVKGRILLGEDNEINQLIVAELLKDQGYELGIAGNGAEVLERLGRERWDLLLVDIHMPVMDGCETASKIRQDGRFANLPIVALTADVFRDNHRRYLASGISDILTKPFEPEQLYRMLERWLG